MTFSLFIKGRFAVLFLAIRLFNLQTKQQLVLQMYQARKGPLKERKQKNVHGSAKREDWDWVWFGGEERSIWRRGVRWGMCMRREEGWWVEVRATEWHSVNFGLMKVLIMELVTFQPVADPVSLIDPLWSVTRRHYWLVPRGPAWTNICAEPPAEISPAPAIQGSRVSSFRAV